MSLGAGRVLDVDGPLRSGIGPRAAHTWRGNVTVKLLLMCNGCGAEAEGTGFLRWEDIPQDLTPEGWMMYDPYTFCTYCPTCVAEVFPETQR